MSAVCRDCKQEKEREQHGLKVFDRAKEIIWFIVVSRPFVLHGSMYKFRIVYVSGDSRSRNAHVRQVLSCCSRVEMGCFVRGGGHD